MFEAFTLKWYWIDDNPERSADTEISFVSDVMDGTAVIVSPYEEVGPYSNTTRVG